MSTGPAARSRRNFLLVAVSALALFGFGCGGDDDSSSFSSSFTPSGTEGTNLVKLVRKSANGNLLEVQAVIYGPTTSIDVYSFSFDVVIGDPTVLAFVEGSAAADNALTVTGGQSITALAAPAISDPTHIVVGISKVEPPPKEGVGGDGNQVTGASAAVVDLSFRFLRQGSSTLAIATSPAPAVQNSNLAVIGSITFDSVAGTATGVSTGGGGPY